MSDLNELFAELKAEIDARRLQWPTATENADEALYILDGVVNNGEFARAERDAYIG